MQTWLCLMCSTMMPIPTEFCALTMQGYIWETGGDKWPARRIIAAFLLTTVTDALMRAARAGAYMMLAVYTLWRVRRKVWPSRFHFLQSSVTAAAIGL